MKVNENIVNLTDYCNDEDVCTIGDYEKPQFGGAYYDYLGNFIYIRKVVFRNKRTDVYWNDGTVTSATCDFEDEYDSRVGVLVAVLKKTMGSDFAVKTLEDWGTPAGSKCFKLLKDVRKAHKDIPHKEG